MKLTKAYLKQLIQEELEIHLAPENLAELDPEEAYGLGYQAKETYDLARAAETERKNLQEIIQEELTKMLNEGRVANVQPGSIEEVEREVLDPRHRMRGGYPGPDPEAYQRDAEYYTVTLRNGEKIAAQVTGNEVELYDSTDSVIDDESLEHEVLNTIRNLAPEGGTRMLNEAKFKVGDKVKHDSDDLGVGKVVAVESGKKGNIVVRWKSGTRKHHRWALKPAA